MNWLIISLVIVLGLAIYFTAVQIALLTYRASVVEQILTARKREVAGQWLEDHHHSMRLTNALLRHIVHVLFVLLLFVLVRGGQLSDPVLIPRLVTVLVISVVVLWGVNSILAHAIARYLTEGLVISALPWLRVATTLCLPMLKILSFVDEIVRRLSGSVASDEKAAEEDLLHRIEETQREGALDEESATMLENIVEFSSTDVAEVMTPRTDIEGIELTNDLASIRSFIAEAGHSRIPVYRDNLDNIAGILYVKDLVPYLGEDASGFALEPLLRQPIIVPETKSVRELLADFQKSEVHMAVVVDEYGGTEGLVTIEDVLEEIVGEIHDEHEPDDEEEPTINRIDGVHFEVDARFHIDDLNEQLGLNIPESAEYDTLGGFVLAQFGKVPQIGESIDLYGARFTTLAASPTHVQRLGVELSEQSSGEDDTAADYSDKSASPAALDE